MGAEMFGAGALPLIAIGCVVAYVFSSHRSIYPSQRIGAPKHAGAVTAGDAMREVRVSRSPSPAPPPGPPPPPA
jgi:hypothetical protein